MKIVVTASTGNIGRVLTSALLDAGEDLVLPVRDAGKAAGPAGRGATVMQGSVEDAAFLTEACRGADLLFWLTPPDFSHDDFLAFQGRMGRTAARAIRDSGIGRVVNVSSVGAQHPEGTGPVKGLREVEHLLEDTPADVTHLRPTFFMENFVPSVQTIAEAGAIFMPVQGATRVAMVATRDVAAVAAETIRDTSWSGRQVREILGPAEYSFDQAAADIGEGLEREVRFVTSDPKATRELLMGFGMSGKVADMMLELYRGIDEGRLGPEQPRTEASTTPTTLTAFARTVLKPMLAG